MFQSRKPCLLMLAACAALSWATEARAGNYCGCELYYNHPFYGGYYGAGWGNACWLGSTDGTGVAGAAYAAAPPRPSLTSTRWAGYQPYPTTVYQGGTYGQFGFYGREAVYGEGTYSRGPGIPAGTARSRVETVPPPEEKTGTPSGVNPTFTPGTLGNPGSMSGPVPGAGPRVGGGGSRGRFGSPGMGGPLPGAPSGAAAGNPSAAPTGGMSPSGASPTGGPRPGGLR
jgi:hypothetical protein